MSAAFLQDRINARTHAEMSRFIPFLKMQFMDEAVQGTADDAITSKLSASLLGYYDDPFISVFTKKKYARRSPLINRGYYSRVAAVNKVVEQFLSLGGKQVVSLGCGFDTLAFRMLRDGVSCHVAEIDFEETVRRKSALISRSDSVLNLLKCSKTSGEIHSSVGYHLAAADLRDVPALEAALQRCCIDWNEPVLFLSECVLVYMAPDESCNVIQWAAERVRQSGGLFMTYEQIQPYDAFGNIMSTNLASRSCALKSLPSHKTKEEQMHRFESNGWDMCKSIDMVTVYSKFLPQDDTKRTEKLELFDEFEEWFLIETHYCVTIAMIRSPNVNLHSHSFFHV